MKPISNWTTPGDIKRQLERYWSNGRLLTAQLREEELFPLELPLRRPDTADLSERFDEVRLWIRDLERGSGYEIEWTIRNYREVGAQRVPAGIVVRTEADALRLLEKEGDGACFRSLAASSLARFPVLISWIIQKPLTVLRHANDWSRLLDVVAWFQSHPGTDLYLRQIEIPGVDTKFIEDRRGLITELLDALSAPQIPDELSVSGRTFEQRFGLRCKPSLIRFRFLDSRLYMQGLSDLAIPSADFARFVPDVTTVFITENDINGLTFPDVPGSLVIFGLGYGLDRLSQAAWLRDKAVYYWGDIDTHGFAMLHRLRTILPDVKSLLMDMETLLLHRDSWVREDSQYDGSLGGLSPDEQLLFDGLRHGRLGERVRLEQERISFGWVRLALGKLKIGR